MRVCRTPNHEKPEAKQIRKCFVFSRCQQNETRKRIETQKKKRCLLKFFMQFLSLTESRNEEGSRHFDEFKHFFAYVLFLCNSITRDCVKFYIFLRRDSGQKSLSSLSSFAAWVLFPIKTDDKLRKGELASLPVFAIKHVFVSADSVRTKQKKLKAN